MAVAAVRRVAVLFPGGSRSGKRDVKGGCARQQCDAAAARIWEGVAGECGRRVRGEGVERAGGGWMSVSGRWRGGGAGSIQGLFLSAFLKAADEHRSCGRCTSGLRS